MNYDGKVICGVERVGTEAGQLCRWGTTDITWNAVFRIGQLAARDVQNAYADAFRWWADGCGIKSRYSSNPRTALIVASAGRIDGQSNTLAWSGLPCGNVGQVEQKYDESEAWVIARNPPGGKVDFTRVAAHEIGHGIGIGHIAAGNLLAPSYNSAIWGLQSGDVQEAELRYGVPGDDGDDDPAAPPSDNEWCKICEAILVGGLGIEESEALRIRRSLASAGRRFALGLKNRAK